MLLRIFFCLVRSPTFVVLRRVLQPNFNLLYVLVSSFHTHPENSCSLGFICATEDTVNGEGNTSYSVVVRRHLSQVSRFDRTLSLLLLLLSFVTSAPLLLVLLVLLRMFLFKISRPEHT